MTFFCYVLCIAFLIGEQLSSAQLIDKVYFAQTHVHAPGDLYSKLVSSRETLIKAQILASSSAKLSPAVFAVLTLSDQSISLEMTGPPILPRSFDATLGIVQHTFSDSFIAYIPPQWAQNGIRIEIQAGNAEPFIIDRLEFGPPSKLLFTMIDFNLFRNRLGENYQAGWREELESRIPVAEIDWRRTSITFPEVIIPARENGPPIMITSAEDYEAKTGLRFDGEQFATIAWTQAIQRASGTSAQYSLYYGSIYGANSGGLGGGFLGVGHGSFAGILLHECGHALNLPHWCGNTEYPYQGPMYGLLAPQGNEPTAPHVGPIWGFDIINKIFLQPTDSSTGNVVFQHDPMCGGGEVSGGQEGILLAHFSDYSVDQMRIYAEGHIVRWDPDMNSYSKWDEKLGAHVAVSNDGLQYPIERDLSVFTVLVQVSVSDPSQYEQVSAIYPPIGPYTAGLIDKFDPTVAEDRHRARELNFCGSDGCDFSVRITQNGVEKAYMIAISQLHGISITDSESLGSFALNLPASAGLISSIELICTPDAEQEQIDQSLKPCPADLARWSSDLL